MSIHYQNENHKKQTGQQGQMAPVSQGLETVKKQGNDSSDCCNNDRKQEEKGNKAEIAHEIKEEMNVNI